MNRFLNKYTLIALVCFLGFLACQKDYSYEHNGSIVVNSIASGSLQDNSGNCQVITVHGDYMQDSSLTADNYITANITFTSIGKFKVYSDTVNGCWFSTDTTTTYVTGLQTIKILAHGKPAVISTAFVNIYFLNSTCTFSFTTIAKPHVSVEKDYFPLTAGTYFVYDTVTNAAVKDTLRYTISSLNQTFNGINYRMILSNHRDTALYRKDGLGHYYRYTTDYTSIGLPGFEYKILDETLPEGSSWETPVMMATYQGGHFPAKMVCTIVKKNTTYSPNGQVLDSVIIIQEAAEADLGNGFQLLFTTNANYAKKIGLVLWDLQALPIYRKARSWYIE